MGGKYAARSDVFCSLHVFGCAWRRQCCDGPRREAAGFVPPDYGESLFESPVTLPECDSVNRKVLVIEQDADWDWINSSTYRIFCVTRAITRRWE